MAESPDRFESLRLRAVLVASLVVEAIASAPRQNPLVQCSVAQMLWCSRRHHPESFDHHSLGAVASAGL